ncbi:hypothetical protein HCU64_06500 [Methylobacterium sp. C25]|uniref:hypothetical protein n=1 Tax=Methylobacterium sp. C25 TaxID=2721622 RepID=UPI001F456121|nr:hypothetical protein [Methylobacterium sp. C25]MCE4223396.1 hypothetical protein [Methylobacterium sp. C25]
MKDYLTSSVWIVSALGLGLSTSSADADRLADEINIDAQVVARLAAVGTGCKNVFLVNKEKTNALVAMRIKSATKKANGDLFFALGAEYTKQYAEQISYLGIEEWCVRQKADLDLIGVNILGESCFKARC